jgi:hypothetical protein
MKEETAGISFEDYTAQNVAAGHGPALAAARERLASRMKKRAAAQPKSGDK